MKITTPWTRVHKLEDKPVETLRIMLRQVDASLGPTSGSARSVRRALDVAEAREGKRSVRRRAAGVVLAIALLGAAGGALGYFIGF